jgi:hypothetical protein
MSIVFSIKGPRCAHTRGMVRAGMMAIIACFDGYKRDQKSPRITLKRPVSGDNQLLDESRKRSPF